MVEPGRSVAPNLGSELLKHVGKPYGNSSWAIRGNPTHLGYFATA